MTGKSEAQAYDEWGSVPGWGEVRHGAQDPIDKGSLSLWTVCL